MIEYSGYVGTFAYDPDIEAFFGEVANTRDAITFYGASVEELKREMARSVDTYLEVCAERGIDPDKPFRGEFLVRADPELHRELALAAAAEEESLNSFVLKALSDAVEDRSAARLASRTRKTPTVRRRPAKAARHGRDAEPRRRAPAKKKPAGGNPKKRGGGSRQK